MGRHKQERRVCREEQGIKKKKLQRTPDKKLSGGYKPKRMKLPLEAENERTNRRSGENENKRHGQGRSPRRSPPRRTKGSSPRHRARRRGQPLPRTTTTSSRGKLKSNDDLCTRTKPWTARVTGGALQRSTGNGNGNRRKHLSIHAISGL